LLFEPKANAISPLNAVTTWPTSSTSCAAQIRETYKEQENGATYNVAQVIRPSQPWSNVYVNNITKADTPSFIEECLAQSSQEIQSIAADYLEQAADDITNQTLVTLARAALQVMSPNIPRPPRASQGKQKWKHEDQRDVECDGRCEAKQVTFPGVPLQVISSNLANTALGRSKKRKHN